MTSLVSNRFRIGNPAQNGTFFLIQHNFTFSNVTTFLGLGGVFIHDISDTQLGLIILL